MKKLIFQGAEAKIFLINSNISKQRIPKTYRHPTLDQKIRTRRTKREAKLIEKARAIKINVPKVLRKDKFNLEIEYIKGDKLSETINAYSRDKQEKTIKSLGIQVSLLHQANIIHGDLTTSNAILKGDEVFIIDFGLGFVSTKIEDKAVDLHLIKQALEAKHFQNHEALFKNFLKGYNQDHEDSKKITERLEIVEKRGRYKH